MSKDLIDQLLAPIGLTVMQLQHQDGCPAPDTQRDADCNCEPDLVIASGEDALRAVLRGEVLQ